MSEESIPEITAPLPEPVDSKQSQESAGIILSAARSAAGMSMEEVAAKLRLSVRQIRALEEGDAAMLPNPTFVRGFIRNYAKLLGLDPDPLISAYAAQAPAVNLQSISLQSENIRISVVDRQSWLPYLLAALLVLMVLVAMLAVTDQSNETPPVAASSASQEVAAVPEAEPVSGMQPAAEAIPMQPVPAPLTPAAPSAATLLPQAEVPAAVASPPLPAPVAAEPSQGGVRLEMSFSEEVWLSVQDGSGKMIFNKTGFANNQDAVKGSPPLQVVIGNAAGVRLTYNGKPVDLAPHTKANVARLTLE